MVKLVVQESLEVHHLNSFMRVTAESTASDAAKSVIPESDPETGTKHHLHPKGTERLQDRLGHRDLTRSPIFSKMLTPSKP
jgi:hypothetical protein